jgi:hypothetical protein
MIFLARGIFEQNFKTSLPCIKRKEKYFCVFIFESNKIIPEK